MSENETQENLEGFMVIDWWLSTPKMTVWVREMNGKVVDAAPIVKRFIGQYLSSLLGWLRRQGQLRQHILSQL